MFPLPTPGHFLWSYLIQSSPDELIKPSEYLVVPFQTAPAKKCQLMPHIQLINHSTHLFPAFITQWFSSGKITRRLGTPSLHRHLISTIHLPPEKRNALLQCMEHSDPISLGEPVVFAPMDRQLRGRPLGHSVRRAVFPRCFECGGLPWASSPFVVELQCVASVVVNIFSFGKKGRTKKSSSVA
jgi:hypothetical protein